ncbi:MAG: hypothetical protein ABFS02_08770 [Pseudomonadota bacterium]
MYQKEKSRHELQRWTSITVSPSVLDRMRLAGRFYLIVAAASLAAVIVLMVLPSKSLLEKYEDTLLANETRGDRLNPVLSEEIKVLKGQLSAVITGSIESKVRILEQNIREGTVSAADLGTIEDLKSDLDILKTYSSHAPSKASAVGARRFRRSDASLESQYLTQELSQVKVLFYISIASCGFLAVAMGGIWLQNTQRFKLLLKKQLEQPAMLEPGDRDFS